MSFTDAKAMAAKAKRANDMAVTSARRAIISAIDSAATSGKTEVDSYALNGLAVAPRSQIILDLEHSGYEVRVNHPFDQRDTESITISWGHA
ncbi:hypothetical protein RCIP0070_00057 [Klebsiella phage RCIP0070]